MTGKLFIPRIIYVFGVPLLLYSILWFLLSNSSRTSEFYLAISIDLLIVVPFIYFLLIRKTSIPNTTVVPVVLGGFLLGSAYLPTEHQTFLQLFRIWVLPVLELGLLAYVVYKLRKAFQGFKLHKKDSPDFFSVLKKTCSEIVPKPLVIPFATEIAVFYYGFIDWKKRALFENEFSYHKKSGSQALMFGIVLVIAVEVYVLHILLLKWSEIAAYIITFVSIYTGLQFIGFAKSISKRPIKIEGDRLILRYGMVNEAVIPFDKIESIEASSSALEEAKLTKRFSLLGELEPHNVVLNMKEIHEFQSLYGTKRKFKTLAFFVDEANEFVESVENKIL